jgi:hypothetical protein
VNIGTSRLTNTRIPNKTENKPIATPMTLASLNGMLLNEMSPCNASAASSLKLYLLVQNSFLLVQTETSFASVFQRAKSE